MMSALPTDDELTAALHEQALDALQSLLGAAQANWDAIKDSGTESKRKAAWAELQAAHTNYWQLKNPTIPRIPAQSMPPKRAEPPAAVDISGSAPATMTAAPTPGLSTPEADEFYRTYIDRTDTGNANLLIKLADGNLRYIHETEEWLWWTGARWQADSHKVFVNTRALEVAKHYLMQAGAMRYGMPHRDQNDDVVDSDDIRKWAAKCRAKSSLDNMVAQARKVAGVPMSVTDLDKNPHLLGVDNGVVDLRTGELREHESREDYITKRSPILYDPSAKCPRWQQLISEVTGSPVPVERFPDGSIDERTVGRYTPRPALASYLHKALGYYLTGLTVEQKFFFAIGEGSNGKGLIFDAVRNILGQYATQVPAAVLMTGKAEDPERPQSMIASISARMVCSCRSITRSASRFKPAVISAPSRWCSARWAASSFSRRR